MTYSQRTTLSVGELDFELHHGRGEADDHTWAWVQQRRARCVGDFVLWVFPNTGNPQEVQGYPLEWARALREMQAHDAELLLPAHGLPIRGTDRIATVLDDLATVLEQLVAEALTTGATAPMGCAGPAGRWSYPAPAPSRPADTSGARSCGWTSGASQDWSSS